ncbi:unnamed protein product [Colias eurytheme]|nr:unnamed protein product [Colias eurytheme]
MAVRRGTPKHIYSDNGTNFVKANSIISEEYEQLQSIFNNSFYREITDMKIEWHFNAPAWPTAGGLKALVLSEEEYNTTCPICINGDQPTVRAVLTVSQDQTLDNLANMADKILENMKGEQIAEVHSSGSQNQLISNVRAFHLSPCPFNHIHTRY